MLSDEERDGLMIKKQRPVKYTKTTSYQAQNFTNTFGKG